MNSLTTMQQVAVWALPVLLAITLHEYAHGWVANRLGDPTARMLGRLTLNPFRHIDPIGTVLVPAVCFLLNAPLFGWARPVPITPENLRHHRHGMALVAAAGPSSNIVMALGWALLARLSAEFSAQLGWIAEALVYMGLAGITINVVLAVLNLLPLPPLDGGRVVSDLLPGRVAARFDRIEPYGMWILVFLLATGLLGRILFPPVMMLQHSITQAFGLA